VFSPQTLGDLPLSPPPSLRQWPPALIFWKWNRFVSLTASQGNWRDRSSTIAAIAPCTLSPWSHLPVFRPGNETKRDVWPLRTWFGIAPVNKLASLAWILWTLTTLHYIARGHRQCSIKFFKVCVRIQFLLCNILPELIWIWNDVCDTLCAKHIFGGNIYVRSMFSCMRSSHGLCARAHAHSLEGTLVIGVLCSFLSYKVLEKQTIVSKTTSINKTISWQTYSRI